MAGTIAADTLTHSTAGSIATNYVVEGSAKAWVNFNGTGTIAARDSFNVSSLTDVSTGRYEVNFTSSMSDANYSRQFSGEQVTLVDSTEISTASKTAVRMINLVGTATDTTYTHCATHGDLA